MTKRPDDRRRKRSAIRFDMVQFLSNVLMDLRGHLGEAFDPLWGSRANPGAFRATIKHQLADADCMASAEYYAALRQVEACVSKLPTWGAKSQSERDAHALGKFLLAQRACKRANRRLSYYRERPGRLRPLLREVIDGAILLIHRALGDAPGYDDLFQDCGFGPGLTYGLTSEERNLLYKLDGDQTVTPECRGLALGVIRYLFPQWGNLLRDRDRSLTQVEGNRIAFVPKTADVSRTIGIEPSLNVFLQKGIEQALRPACRRMGITLTDQENSISCMRKHGRRISTIDLSSASDSVSRELVRWLFPAEWFAILDEIRSPNYTLDKGVTWCKHELFSSMGNATTFPVESLIFMALAKSTCQSIGISRAEIKDCVRVYGDDIIVPWEASALLMETLRFLGFKINTDKTFVFGPFRETCGCDLLDGVDVRPVYLRKTPSRPSEVAGFHNRLLSNRYGFIFTTTCSWLHSLVDKPYYGPAYYGYASVKRTDWHTWYAGKSDGGDAYFFAPSPPFEPVTVVCREHPTQWYGLDKWGITGYAKIDGFPETALHLAFLLGLEEGRPKGEPHYGTVSWLYTGHWPYVDAPWAAVIPRRPSERVIRQVCREVVGGVSA